MCIVKRIYKQGSQLSYSSCFRRQGARQRHCKGGRPQRPTRLPLLRTPCFESSRRVPASLLPAVPCQPPAQGKPLPYVPPTYSAISGK